MKKILISTSILGFLLIGCTQSSEEIFKKNNVTNENEMAKKIVIETMLSQYAQNEYISKTEDFLMEKYKNDEQKLKDLGKNLEPIVKKINSKKGNIFFTELLTNAIDEDLNANQMDKILDEKNNKKRIFILNDELNNNIEDTIGMAIVKNQENLKSFLKEK